MTLTGVNGKRLAIKLSALEMVEDMGDEVAIFSASDWYRVRDNFDSVMERWREYEDRA